MNEYSETLALRKHQVNSAAQIYVSSVLLFNPPMDIDEIRRQNIRALEEQHGAPALSSKAGMSLTQFYNLRDGAKDSRTGKKRGMRKETAWRIEDAAGVPRGYLDIPHSELPNGPSQIPPVSLESHPDLFSVPRVRFKLSAGISGFSVEPENGNGKPIFFRRDWFDTNGYKPESLFAVRVQGVSMEPSLWDGDLVVINTADTKPVDGDVFAINYEGELVVKRLRRDEGQWFACSDNADQRRFAPKRCTEDVQIIGKAVYRQGERI